MPTLAELEEQRVLLTEQIAEKKRSTTITCHHCGKRSQIKNLVFMQPQCYEEPYGCTGGDYWYDDETKFYFKCPKCEEDNQHPRFIPFKDPQYKSKSAKAKETFRKLHGLRFYFSKIVRYDRRRHY